jgi:uncharacterized repeat protein (TIGR01451 family)
VWVGDFIQPLNDGGILVATSVTNTSTGDLDCHLVRFNADNAIVWEKIYGSLGEDGIKKIVESPMGGFILAGMSTSGDGIFSSNHGQTDIWIMHVDEDGNILWSKMYGGSNDEIFQDLVMDSDGGYVVAGSTTSRDGDLSRDSDDWDPWLFQISEDGAIALQYCPHDPVDNFGMSVAGDPFNGKVFLVQKFAASIGADSTELIGLNYQLIERWRKFVGPTSNISNEGKSVVQYNPNTQSIVVATTKSLPRSSNPTDFGRNYWMNFTQYDGNGNYMGDIDLYDITNPALEWRVYDLRYQGNDWILVGAIRSLNARQDAIMACINQYRQVTWQKQIKGSGSDLPKSMNIDLEGNILVAGNSNSHDGDMTTNFGKGPYQLWLMKIGIINLIQGSIFVDVNGNNKRDLGENVFRHATVNIQKGAEQISTIAENGAFRVPIDTGTYVTSIATNRPYYLITPASYTTSHNTPFNSDSLVFALKPAISKEDLQINVFPMTHTRLGTDAIYKVIYTNNGTIPMNSGTITLVKDSKLDYHFALPFSNRTSGDSIFWNYSDLTPSDTASIIVFLEVQYPPRVNLGDTLRTVAFIDQPVNDIDLNDNKSVFAEIIRSSFDPNDMVETHNGTIRTSDISNNEYLTYTIRFQNTGNDTAFGIRVKDTLDDKLDWNSFEMVNASRPYELTLSGNNKLSWEFMGIRLPDSSTNEPASHGYIAYRIKPKSTLAPGDKIHNDASIFFDYNLPVATNTVITELLADIVLPIRLMDFQGSLKKSVIELIWKTASESNSKLFEVQKSIDGINFKVIGTVASKNSSAGAA